jgi:tRNA A37 threonylcarbamoyladenosine modification protein TsaB
MRLVISTESNQKFSIALADASQLIDYILVEKPFVQSELALKTIDQLFKKHKVGKRNLKEIIVISGPGDFSAVRIGISIANALAYAWNVPVKGVELEKQYRAEESKLKDVLKMSEKVKAGNIAKPIYIAEPNITKKS